MNTCLNESAQDRLSIALREVVRGLVFGTTCIESISSVTLSSAAIKRTILDLTIAWVTVEVGEWVQCITPLSGSL